MTDYVFLEEILEREDPRVTNEDFGANAQASYEREAAALTGAADAVKKVWIAANQAAMLALNLAKVGHEAKRTDTKTVYTLQSLPATTLANWELTGRYEINVAIENITGLQAVLDDKPSFDEGTGKIKTSDLPESVLGALQFKGTWNANTNQVASDDGEWDGLEVPAAAAGNKGVYLVVQTGGTTEIDGVNEWAAGDWIVSIGTKWEKLDATDIITMVNGKVGAVVLNADDIEPTGPRSWVGPGEKDSWNAKLGPDDIANNLTDGDASKVLSAAQGPVLDARISDLEEGLIHTGEDIDSVLSNLSLLAVEVSNKQPIIAPAGGWVGGDVFDRTGFSIADFGEGGSKTVQDLAAIVAAIIQDLKTQGLFQP